MENQKKKKLITLFGAASVISVVLLFAANVPIVNAATLRLSPGAGSYFVGSTFDLSVVLDTKANPVNLIEVELFFPPDKLQLASPSVGKSIIQFWPAPPVFSNQEGRIYFAGAAANPGINADGGLVLTLTFSVVSAGEAEIRFGDKTSVLANDGKGTEVLEQTQSAFFRFSYPPPLGPVISSPTHPDQEKWYRDNNPIFLWPKSPGAEAYSFVIDRDPGGVPDTTAEGTQAAASFKELESGIWYFHLREKARGVWGGASLYAVKIDNEPPAEFRVNISPSARTANRSPIFRFFTTDALSGIDHYEMKQVPLRSAQSVQALFFRVDSPYQAQNLAPGRYQILVRAFDAAGNARDATATLTIRGAGSWFFDSEGVDLYFVFIPWRHVALGAGLIFLVFLFLVARLWLRHQHHVAHAFREDIENLFRIFKKTSRKQT